MSELADPTGAGAGTVAIVLLLVLVAEHQLLGVLRGAGSSIRQRKRALLVVIAPLLPIFVLVIAFRVIHIASLHP
jgi:hypothetical protein